MRWISGFQRLNLLLQSEGLHGRAALLRDGLLKEAVQEIHFREKYFSFIATGNCLRVFRTRNRVIPGGHGFKTKDGYATVGSLEKNGRSDP